MKPYKKYDDFLMEHLKNPKEAEAYLNESLKAGDKKAFLLALRNVVRARGGMTKVSRGLKMHRVSLYKMLSADGNPGLDSLLALLNALGAHLSIINKPRHGRAA